jgi:NAD-dependent dihydropyrimidine dehydrogenase PreA subunit
MTIKIIVDHDKCTGSGECVVVCPRKALSLVDGKAVLDEEKCDLDGICIPACPEGAIKYWEEN